MLFHFPSFESLVYIFFRFLIRRSDSNKKINVKFFQRGSCPKQGQKTTKYWYKIFLLKQILQFWIKKNSISKLSIEMFIKRKTRAGKHCVKRVQIRSFFWSVFSRIRTEYGEILRISPYSVWMRGNTDQKKLRILTHFTQWRSMLTDCFWVLRRQ